MADRLTVDLHGLDGLAQRLRRVKEDLDAARNNLSGQGEVLGHPRVTAALDEFEEHWRDGRKKVSENAEALATMVTEAVRAYRSADEQLGAAVGGVGQQLQQDRCAATAVPASATPAQR
ncbi:hypothetical protein NUM3379_43040 [Kineococcus sp. NUM-3379]